MEKFFNNNEPFKKMTNELVFRFIPYLSGIFSIIAFYFFAVIYQIFTSYIDIGVNRRFS